MATGTIDTCTKIGVDFSERGRIAVLHMQNGENKFTPEFFRNFHSALDEVEQNPSTCALVTTGDGKFFSNGLDLRLRTVIPQQEWVEFLGSASSLLKRLATFPVPTVAAINGHAFGLGALLALSHDYRVMRTHRGWFCLPALHVKFQLLPSWMTIAKTKLPSSEHIPCIVLGKRYTGEEALKTGIVHRTSSNTELMDTALTLAQETVGKEDYDRDMLSKMKQDLYADLNQQHIQYSSKL